MTDKEVNKLFYRSILILITIALILAVRAYSSTRCIRYSQQEKLAHYEVFGIDYPYWFGIGQIQQESGCRNILSKDGIGSEGLPQITFRVWKNYLKKYKIYSVGSVKNQIRAQALIMRDCKKQAYSSHLWVAYQSYNGGPLVNKEIKKAREATGLKEIPWCLAYRYCKRRNIVFNNEQIINACKINYLYSIKVYKYGMLYKIVDSDYIFW